MLTITAQELKLKGIDSQKVSQIVYQDTVFHKSLDFSVNARAAALKFCQKSLDTGILCLLVEQRLYLTVWLAEPKTESIVNTPVISPHQTTETEPLETTQITQSPEQSQLNQPNYTVDATVDNSTSEIENITSPPKSVAERGLSKDDKGILNNLESVASEQHQKSPKKQPRRTYRGIYY